jgi:hypothetical protein
VIPKELQPIVDGLVKKAELGEVNWVPAADLAMGSDTDDVVVSFPDFAVNLYRSMDDDGEDLVVFNVLNSKGNRIHGTALRKSDPGYPLLERLMELATRKISGIDEILASLQRAVDQQGVIGRVAVKKTRQRDEELPF